MKTNACLSENSLNLYCSGDLSRDEMLTATEHLATCPDCSRELNSIQNTLATLSQVDLSLTEAEKLRFADRVSKATQKRPSANKLQIWGAASTTVAAGLLAIFIFNPGTLTPNKQKSVAPQFAELDLVENLELLEDMELLEIMALLEQLEDEG